jgi:hypothetical protein
MAKTKTPDLAGWLIRSADPAAAVHVVVRASALRFREGWAVLEDAAGNPLFAAPHSGRLIIRRLEPGETAGPPPAPPSGPAVPGAQEPGSSAGSVPLPRRAPRKTRS